MEPCLVSASVPSAVPFEHQSQDKAWDLGVSFKPLRVGLSPSPALSPSIWSPGFSQAPATPQ